MTEHQTHAWPFALVALALSVLAGCGRPGEEPPVAGERAVIPAVEVVQARLGTLPLFRRLTGTVRAAGEVAIFPETEGVAAEVFVQNGDRVSRGDPLVRIRTPGSEPQLAQAQSSLAVARAELRQAQANLEELESQFERTRALGEQGLVPEDTVVTQRSQVEAARANLSRAKAQVNVAEATLAERSETQDQTLVRAPISGLVGQRNAEVGMRVDSQTALFIMGRLDDLRVEVPVTQDILTLIANGQRVEIGVPGRAEPIEATVSRISPFLQTGSYSAEVEIDVPNEDRALVPGMFVTVDLFYGESQKATIVPKSAVYDHPITSEQGVFVTTNPPATAPAEAGDDVGGTDPVRTPFRAITVVAEGPQTVGVRGIEPGTWVVVVGQHLLSEQASEGAPQARVRVVTWDRILELQRFQRDDLLREFMDKQKRMADRSVTQGGL